MLISQSCTARFNREIDVEHARVMMRCGVRTIESGPRAWWKNISARS